MSIFQNFRRWHLLKVLQWACQFLMVCLYHMLKTLSERFFCLFWTKCSPVGLIESIALSLSIPNCLLVSYMKTLSETFFVFIFQNFRRWHLLKVLQWGMSLSIPNSLLVSYVQNFIWNIFLCLFFKILPVALIEGIAMSLSIPNCPLVSYIKIYLKGFSLFSF